MQVIHVLSSCQTIASTLAAPVAPFRYIPVLFIMALFIKLFFSWLKTYQSLSVYRQQQIPHPAWLQKLVIKIAVPTHRVLLVPSPQAFAHTIGFWAPTIVISTAIVKRLTKAELESVLWHESFHARYWHPILSVMADSMTQIFFFLPSLIDTASYVKTYLEHQADCFAAQQQQTTQHLQDALAKLILNPKTSVADYPSFAAIALADRIDALQSHRLQVHYSLRRGMMTVVALLMLFGLIQIYQRVSAPVYASAPTVASCSFTTCVSRCLREEFMSTSPRVTPVDKLSSSYYTL